MTTTGPSSSPLQDRLAGFLRTEFSGRIGVAVSGGGDSMALLHAAAAGLADRVAAVTVDHGLRAESAAEAAMVARFCAGLGVDHETLRWTGWDGQGNLQAAAREGRYRLIADWARRKGIVTVLLGHTLDDQAETFVMRLARSSGVDGLAAMKDRFDKDGVEWGRPLLSVRRAELREYLTEKAIPFVDDPSNDNDVYERVRVRKALVLLEDLGIAATVLADVAANLAEAKQALTNYTATIAAQILTHDRGDVLIDLAEFAACDPEIRRRLIAAALRWMNGATYPPRRAALAEFIEGLLQERQGTLAGCLGTVKGGTVRLGREFNAVRDTVSLTSAVWDHRWQLAGPHEADLEIRPLGAAIAACPDWRASGLPRSSLLASPAIWRDDTLVAAPLAGLENGWSAQISAEFDSFLLSH